MCAYEHAYRQEKIEISMDLMHTKIFYARHAKTVNKLADLAGRYRSLEKELASA